MQHIVKKQVIEVKLSGRENAFQIQNEVSNFYWKKIIPELEKIFDQMGQGTDIIYIDKLEIELGALQVAQLASAHSLSEICPGIISRIRDKILTQLKKDAWDRPISITAQWMYYMGKGYLNWNTVKTDASWDQRVLEGFATDFASITLLRKLVRSNEQALHRIATRHNDLFLVRLTEVLTAEKQHSLLAVIGGLEAILDHCRKKQKNISNADIKSIRQKTWEKIIEYAAGKREKLIAGKLTIEKLTAETLADDIIRWLIQQNTEMDWLKIVSATHSDIFQRIIRAMIQKNDKVTSQGSENNQHGRDRQGGETSPGATMNDYPDESVNKKNRKNENVQRPNKKSPAEAVVVDALKKLIAKKKEANHETDSATLEDEIFAEHAGIVLLHPFFSSLFSKLGLLREGKFVDDAAQQRALYILHYLVTGREEAEEFELVLPKLLTGYSLERIVAGPVALEQSEKEETVNLLEVAIEKWKMLGSTSPATLQESFLQRRGKLFSKDQTWHLQMERGSFDMLLDHLPWNLSIIKLPWMKSMLKVDWR